MDISSFGPIPIDIKTIEGDAPGAAAPLPTRLTNGSNYISASNPLPVNVVDSVSGTLVDTYGTSASVAAGDTWTFDGATFADDELAELTEITASSTAPLKISLFKTINGVEDVSPSRIFFTSTSSPTLVYSPSNSGLLSGTGGAGTNKFTMKIKNMHGVFAADIYASVTYNKMVI